jgi:putative ABC transport system ATP-binding protein
MDETNWSPCAVNGRVHREAFGLLPVCQPPGTHRGFRSGLSTDPARDRRVMELLELVELGAGHHRPHELSGGEQQRVAIARALANQPSLLLADEPTGQLDSETGHRIMLLLRTVVRTEGITAVVATHDPMMLDVADRVLELRDGQLVQ